MINFTNEKLVQPELCRLLAQSIPEELHCPVIFYNRRPADFDRRIVAKAYGGADARIAVNLSWIWVMGRGDVAHLWKELLHTCYHEFGHLATAWTHEYVSGDEYEARGPRYLWLERLADDWADRRLGILLAHDSRLGQPRRIGGYLGARLAQQMKWLAHCEGGSGKAAYIRARRFLKTGGQFTAGEVLGRLSCPGWEYGNAYQLLRRASEGIGIEYMDACGRHHKLYTWGDIPLLGKRLDYQRLRRRAKMPWAACEAEDDAVSSVVDNCHPLADEKRLQEWVEAVEEWERVTPEASVVGGPTGGGVAHEPNTAGQPLHDAGLLALAALPGAYPQAVAVGSKRASRRQPNQPMAMEATTKESAGRGANVPALQCPIHRGRPHHTEGPGRHGRAQQPSWPLLLVPQATTEPTGREA